MSMIRSCFGCNTRGKPSHFRLPITNIRTMVSSHRLLLLVACFGHNCAFRGVSAQRFLRQSNNEDFAAEARLDDSEKVAGLSRELTLAGNVEWELPTVSFDRLPNTNGQLRKHVHKYLGRNPVRLKLLKERNKNGSLRAVGLLPNGKKLRVLWREGPIGPRSDLLTVSYEEALRSRLPPLELEVVLPPLPGRRRERVLPSVTYRFPMGSGAINPKTVIPRTAAQVHVWPEGRRLGEENVACVEVGECHVSATPLRVGMIDPSWAKGRLVFRRGRKSGLV